MKNTIFVLGNGPSLRGFDLRRLQGYGTLGMNAAYRFWDRIGWYPSYYCCLDDQLIETHHEAVNRLYEQRQVKSFFLHGRFFDLHPDKIGNPAFMSFDQASSYWYRTRGKEMGFEPLFQEIPFRTKDPDKVTTGAYAVRYANYMGFDRIILMGIDLNYTEILKEARETEGTGLVMNETPTTNPNYFFDDYQQAGDRYNIPNPVVHNGNLHPRSFELVASDFRDNNIDCEILNANPESLLNEMGIFPLINLDKALPTKSGSESV